MNWNYLTDILISVIPAIICLSIHELSHGYAAYLLGDDTAKADGRISLNPIRHIDPIGFAMMVFVGFGWAKPVRVNMFKFKNPKIGMAITAFAGPFSNFLLAIVMLFVYGAFATNGFGLGGDLLYYADYTISRTILLSVSLGVFNLFPIPPLDGSKILEAVFPEKLYIKFMKYEKYGMILLFIGVMSGYLTMPLTQISGFVLELFSPISEFSFKLFAGM